jgi:hypothetical protein
MTWGFVLTESVSRIITQSPAYKTSIRPSSIQTTEASTTMQSKRTWVFTSFFLESNLPHYAYKDITAFESTLRNVCFLPHKMLFVSPIYPA